MSVLLPLLVSFLSGALALQQPPDGAKSGTVEKSLSETPSFSEAPPQRKPSVDVEQARPEMKSPDDSKVRFHVERIKVTGNSSIGDDDIYAVIAGDRGVVGAEMSLAEIKQEAQRITKLYRDRGFVISWAYVPAQEVKEGVVEIAVIEGEVEKILVGGNKHYSAEFIVDHVTGLQAGRAMTMEDLERGLLTLNDYPGLSVRAKLRQGEAPGSTDLYLSAEDKFPVNFVVDYDNFGSESVGEHRLGGHLEVFNLFDIGHSVSLRGVTALGAEDGELAYGRVGYEAPFASGVKLSAFGSRYDYEAKGPVAILDPTGRGEVMGMDVSYPFVRSDSFTLSASLGYEHKDLEQELFGFTTGEDNLRIAKISTDLHLTDGWWGRWMATFALRQGLGEFAGGMKEDDPDASRLGADGNFARANLTVYRLQKIADWLHAIGKVHVQYAVDPLVVSEQISLGGHDGVRGYPAFEFMGDRGMTASLETRIRLGFLDGIEDPFGSGQTLYDMLQLAAFIDYGEAIREEPAFGERDRRVLSGAGVGLRLNFPETGSVRVDFGFPLSDYEAQNGDDSVVYVSLVLNLH